MEFEVFARGVSPGALVRCTDDLVRERGHGTTSWSGATERGSYWSVESRIRGSTPPGLPKCGTTVPTPALGGVVEVVEILTVADRVRLNQERCSTGEIAVFAAVPRQQPPQRGLKARQRHSRAATFHASCPPCLRSCSVTQGTSPSPIFRSGA